MFWESFMSAMGNACDNRAVAHLYYVGGLFYGMASAIGFADTPRGSGYCLAAIRLRMGLNHVLSGKYHDKETDISA